MTDHDPLHLDDEALSAVLDGEASADESQHADTCAACSARLATLRDASMLVRSPVAPADPERRELAIAAALEAFDAGKVVPMRRRVPPAWLGVAAAALVAVAAVSLLRGGDGPSSDEVATGADDADEPAQLESIEEAGDQAATMSAPAGPIDLGDLGELDGTDLRATLDDSAQRSAAGSGAAAGSGGGASDSALADGAEAAVPCEQAIREGNPDLGALALRATGTYQGDPVIVLGFDVPVENGFDRWVYVVGVEGCTIRVQETYSPGG